MFRGQIRKAIFFLISVFQCSSLDKKTNNFVCLEFFALNSYYQNSDADVAELVDAQVSEACELKLVMVRFHSSALILKDEK